MWHSGDPSRKVWHSWVTTSRCSAWGGCSERFSSAYRARRDTGRVVMW